MTKALSTTKPTPEEPKLSGRRLMFAEQYMVDRNGAAAYRRAGYKTKNGDVAAANASRLLRDDRVRAYIRSECAKKSELLGLHKEAVLTRLAIMAFADLGLAYDKDGNVLPVHLMPDSVRLALAAADVVEMAGGMEIETGKRGSDGVEGGGIQHVAMYTKKLKLVDQLDALKLLATLAGFMPDVKVSGTIQHQHTHRLSKEQADAAFRAAGVTIEGEKVAA